MADLAELNIKIVSEQVAQANQRLTDLEKQAAKTEKSVVALGRANQKGEQEAKKATSGFAGLVGSVNSLFLTLGGGLILRSIQRTIDLTTRIRDLSIQTGISVEALSELSFAAEQNGADAETLSQSLTIAARNLQEFALTGKGEAKLALAVLGDSFMEAVKNGATLEELLPDISEALQEMGESERVFVTSKLFGRGGPRLIQLLTQDIEEARKEARRFGAQITQQEADALEEYSDKVKQLESSWESLKRSLITRVAPTANEILDLFNDIANEPDVVVRDFGLGIVVGLENILVGAAEVAGFDLPRVFLDWATSIQTADEKAKEFAETLKKLPKGPITGFPTQGLQPFGAGEQSRAAFLAGLNPVPDANELVPIMSTLPEEVEKEEKLTAKERLRKAMEDDKLEAQREEAPDQLRAMIDALEEERAALNAGTEDRDLAVQVLRAQKLAQLANTDEAKKLADAFIKEATAVNETRKAMEALEKEQEENERRAREAAEFISANFADAATQVVFSTKKIEDAVKDMLMNISQQVLNNAIRNNLGNLLTGIFGATGQVGGAVSTVLAERGMLIYQGNPQPFQYGGTAVTEPSLFPLAGGRMGMRGEKNGGRAAQTEAIFPVTRGPDGRLGVEMVDNGGGGGTVINQHISISTPNVDSFHRSIRQTRNDLSRMSGSAR